MHQPHDDEVRAAMQALSAVVPPEAMSIPEVQRVVREAVLHGATASAVAALVLDLLDRNPDLLRTADRAAATSATTAPAPPAPAAAMASSGPKQQEPLVSVKLTCREAEQTRLYGMVRTQKYEPLDWVAEPMAPENADAVDPSAPPEPTPNSAGKGASYASPDDAKPPVGFEFVPGSTWPRPEQWTYHNGSRESAVYRSARCTATAMQPAQVDVPSLRRESLDDQKRRFDTRGTFSLFLSTDRSSADLTKKMLGPLTAPTVDPAELKVQRVLSLAWVAAQAAYLDTKMDRPVYGSIGHPGAAVHRRINPSVRLRVTRTVNSTDVMVIPSASVYDGSSVPSGEACVGTRDLQLTPLTAVEEHLGQYGDTFRFHTAVASSHDEHTTDGARHHHVILTLSAASLDGGSTSSATPAASDLMVLACRGSRSPLSNLSDWRTNLTLGTKTAVAHEGFSARADTIPLLVLVDHLRQGGSVLLTGHSLGSAVAELVAQRVCDAAAAAPAHSVLRHALDEGRILFIGFASPAIGTAAFNDVSAAHARHFIHILNENDVVPHISNISVLEPKLFEKGVESAVWLVQALVTQNPLAKFAMDVASTALKAYRNQSSVAPPFETARGYHFVRKSDGSVTTFFVDRGGQAHGFSTANFLARLQSLDATINSVADHQLDSYEYAVSTRRKDGLTQPLYVPNRGLRNARWPDAGFSFEGRMHHHLSQRCLVLTTRGEMAQWLSICDLHARVTLVAGGSQSLLTNARMVTTAGETAGDDSTKVYFDAPGFQCAGSVVTLHVTPRYPYARNCDAKGVPQRIVLTCPVERAVDMSVLSTVYQAHFLTVGAEVSNDFTRGIGEKLMTLERIVSHFARVPCMEDAPVGESTRTLCHPTVGACRAALPPDAMSIDVLIGVMDSETSFRLVRHDGELVQSNALDYERFVGSKPYVWHMSALANANSYDFTPVGCAMSPVLDLTEMQLAFHRGAYRLTKGGLALDAVANKVQLQPKRETEAARFLIFEATSPFTLIAPVPTTAPLRTCARVVVVQREANGKALDAPTFLSIVTNPEAYLTTLLDDEKVLAQTPLTVEIENDILSRDTTTRVVDVLGTYGVLPPAVPMHKLLTQREANRRELQATNMEPPVTRYFFCGMATITSWILEACSVVLHDKSVSRGSWLWELLFSGGSDDSRTAVDKTYVAQLEYLCSLIDDPRFNIVRDSMKHRSLGRGGEQSALKDLHRRLLEYHEAEYPATDVMHFATGWLPSGNGVPLPLLSSVKGDRAVAARLMYAFMVTVAMIERDVSECSAVAAFGLKGAGKSTLLHALSQGGINPTTRGTDVSTYEAVAFFGQTPKTHRTCVIDCPGTNEDRHELRALQRLMFGAVKLIFVVQSLNKEAQNQLDVLQPVLANANPEATVVVVFTHFTSRFTAAWQDQVSSGFPAELHITRSGACNFDFDGAAYSCATAPPLSTSAASSGTRLMIARGATAGTVFLLDPTSSAVVAGPFTKASNATAPTQDGADASTNASAAAAEVVERFGLVLFPYTPPAVSADRSELIQRLRQRLDADDHADVTPLYERVVKCLQDDQGRLCAESQALAERFHEMLVDSDDADEIDASFLVSMLSDPRKLQLLLAPTGGASNKNTTAQLKAYKMGSTVPIAIINQIRAAVRTSVSKLKEACPALRRTPLHRCVIFQPRTEQLLGAGLLEDLVIVKLGNELSVDVPKYQGNQSLRRALKIEVTDGTQTRIAVPGDATYTADAVAALFEHPTVAGRAVFDEADLRALLLSTAGAPTVSPTVFHLLCGVSEEASASSS